MGYQTYSTLQTNSTLNLYNVANNKAALKENDSSNWANYNVSNLNDWGEIRRHWDANRNSISSISISALKQIGENHSLFGYLIYTWDYRNKLTNAIEKNPYSFDPFVLADYTVGNFLFHGPEIFVAYNYQLLRDLCFGTSLQYYVGRGLKNVDSEAEIISREITFSLDMVYKYNDQLHLGLSIFPGQYLDITKLDQQTDGIIPKTKRYSGEFFYQDVVSNHNRTANYDGYLIRPQFYYNKNDFLSIFYMDYYYLWHSIYDGEQVRNYNGFFEANHYKLSILNRYTFSRLYNSGIFLKYEISKYDDWAKPGDKEILIFSSKCMYQHISTGCSFKVPNVPVIVATELSLLYQKPDQKDYITNIFRNGGISKWNYKIGIEYLFSPFFRMRSGINLVKYNESKEWNYFKNYIGAALTLGFGWIYNNYNINFHFDIGQNIDTVDHYRKKTTLNFMLEFKQSL